MFFKNKNKQKNDSFFLLEEETVALLEGFQSILSQIFREFCLHSHANRNYRRYKKVSKRNKNFRTKSNG